MLAMEFAGGRHPDFALMRTLPGCRPCGLDWDQCQLELSTETEDVLTITLQLGEMHKWNVQLNKCRGKVQCNLQELEILRWIAEEEAHNEIVMPAVEYVPQKRYPCNFPHTIDKAHDVLEIVPGMSGHDLHKIGEEALRQHTVLLCPAPVFTCKMKQLHRGVSEEVHKLAAKWPLRQITSAPSAEGMIDIAPVAICRNSPTRRRNQCVVFARGTGTEPGILDADAPAEIRPSVDFYFIEMTPSEVSKRKVSPDIALHSSWCDHIPNAAQPVVFECKYRGVTVRPTRLYDAFSRTIRPQAGSSDNGPPPIFLALSYSWDEWKDDEALKDQLSGLSVRLGIRYFWVDRWCVLQDNDADKAREVPRMGEYYRGASGCVVLAGHSVQPFKCLPRHSGAILSSFQQILLNRAAIESLARCIWCKRVWTLQEALLSRQVIYAVKGQLVDGDYISELVACLTRASERYKLPPGGGRPQWIGGYGCYRWNARAPSVIRPYQFNMDEKTGNIVIIRSVFGGEQQFFELRRGGCGRGLMPLEEGLSMIRDRSSTKQEDAIYGLLGISEGGENISVEYTIPWGTMLRKLVRAGMITERQLASSSVNEHPGMSWLPGNGENYGPFLRGEPLATPINRPVLSWRNQKPVVTGARFEWLRDAKCETWGFFNIHGMQCRLVRGTICFPEAPGLLARVGGTSSVSFTPERLTGIHVMLCKGVDRNTRDTIAMRVSGNIKGGRVRREDGYVLELHHWLRGDPASLVGKQWILD